MKSLLEQTDALDKLSRQLRKMESKLRSGQFIDAWRDCNRIIAEMDRSKRDLIKGSSDEE